MSRKNFIKGAAILGIAGLLAKILGFFYRIPIVNILGDVGNGYLMQSFQVYNILLALSTSGLNVAIAKLVSEKRAMGSNRGAHRVFEVSLMMLAAGGAISAIIVYLGADAIVRIGGNSNAYYSMVALIPALFFVPIMSSFRGYFQGRQNMTPTAVSQVVEQFIRVIIGLWLAYILVDSGIDIASGGASFGSSAGAIVGTMSIVFIYMINRKKIKKEFKQDTIKHIESKKTIMKRIMNIAIPLSIGAIVVPSMTFIDIAIITKRIQLIGYTEQQATGFVGQIGMANTIINVAMIFSVSLAMSLVPIVSEYNAKNNYNNIKRITKSGIRMALLIGLPAALGISILSTDIIKLLYYSRSIEVKESAGGILEILAFTVLFLTLVQSLTAILQGLGKVLIPIKNLAIGAIIKIVLTYILIVMPGIGIKGAAISTVSAYLVAAILDFIAVKKYTATEFEIKNIFVKPLVSVSIMSVTVWVFHKYIFTFIDPRVNTLLSVCVGVLTYGIALIITGSITATDFSLLPGGNKIAANLKKVGILR
ncbi:putative polysaccharide biosynthesis protein [Clostridiisalibacter paucivorans]|uniref:putative polysaccharide biosynthesis protein n=1 Tax=Clostridiisalibacter paucivorans TaxID=408753 RepID=UPI00047EFD53|nr:polysaccharide biosynthesis protein [Clostridiisalibacter paucivorans]